MLVIMFTPHKFKSKNIQILSNSINEAEILFTTYKFALELYF